MASKTVPPVIKQFFDLEREIWALAGCDDVLYSGVEDGTQNDWYLSKMDFFWGKAGTEEYYGGSPRCSFKGEHYTIIVFDDGQGNSQRACLVDNSKETTYEAFEGDD